VDKTRADFVLFTAKDAEAKAKANAQKTAQAKRLGA
jgi:hypothetical protein